MANARPDVPGVPGAAATFAWRPGDREFVLVGSRPAAPDVADSWLVDHGLARGLRLHRERFAAACGEHYGVPASVVAEFVAAASSAVPDHGLWFPRVEYHRDEGLLLRIRAVPDNPATVVMTVAKDPDPRRQPNVKGPDLETLTRLRAAAATQGASEVLLVRSDGTVLEGALSSVMWWSDDTLCMPPPDLPLLPSVTRALILGIAARRQARVRFEVCLPERLDGAEIWTASALTGIRAVTGWIGGGVTPGRAERAGSWQRELLAMAVPVASAIA